MPAPVVTAGRLLCPECNKPLRRDNKYGYCRLHRNRSPVFRAKVAAAARAWRKHRMSVASKQRFRDSNREASRRWRERNKEKKKLINLRWIENNPERRREQQKRARDKMRSTVKGKWRHRLEVRFRASLKDMKSGRKWEKLVGYTVDALAAHLESRFANGMTWERFHAGDIHIDHIRPVSMFDIHSTDDQAFKDCWALSNLQPLWADDHRKKSAIESTIRAKADRLRARHETTQKRREIR